MHYVTNRNWKNSYRISVHNQNVLEDAILSKTGLCLVINIILSYLKNLLSYLKILHHVDVDSQEILDVTFADR